MFKNYHPTHIIGLVVSLLLFAGCGRVEHFETAKVTGLVTLDGKPMSIGTVIFTPEHGRAATAPIQSDGTYTLTTYREGDGAVFGKHQVAVVAREKAQGSSPMHESSGKWLIPKRYGDYTRSGLSFQVKPEGPNIYNIELSSDTGPENP